MVELDDDTISRLGHRNYIEFTREFARWSGRNGTVLEEDGLVLHASASPFPVLFNGMWRVDPTVDADEAITRTDAFFGERARGYSIAVRNGWAEDEDLRVAAVAAGLLELSSSPEMVCRQPVELRPLADGVELGWVHDQATLDDFVAVTDAAYATIGMAAGAIAETITDLAAVTTPTVHTVIAYLHGMPVGGAQVILSDTISGVYCVGTIESARGHGIGDAVTRAVTNRAFELGAGAVTLQASAMGEPIYLKMGYEELYRYTTYVRFEPVPA